MSPLALEYAGLNWSAQAICMLTILPGEQQHAADDVNASPGHSFVVSVVTRFGLLSS